MEINEQVLQELLSRASVNLRLRTNLDLRNSPEDGSQRMLNAILPDSMIPIHRHNDTTETVLILKGIAVEIFYDSDGHIVNKISLDAVNGNYGVQVPVGVWHSLRAITPCVIFEAKDGPYAQNAIEFL